MFISITSWLAGALLVSLLYRDPLPVYIADLPRQPLSGETLLENVWLRPGATTKPALPSLCTFLEGRHGLQPLTVPYTASAAGSLRLGQLGPLPGSVVLVLGLRLPPCPGLALLGSLGGSYGPLFRGFLKLAGAQVLRLPPAATSATTNLTTAAP